MDSSQTQQYTVRNVSARVDQALRRRSKTSGKSLNDTLLDVLEQGAGLGGEPVSHHDLDDLIGSWREDADFDKTLKAQRKIDREKWK